MKTIETYLPIFPGFYSTIFEADEEQEIDNINEEREKIDLEPITFDDCQWDYKGFREYQAKCCIGFIEQELNRVFINQIKVIYEAISSPREYNFGNDSINVSFNVSNKFLKELKQYLIDNKETYSEHVKERYTSRSGFSSFYSNDVNTWLTEYFNEIETNSHILGAILDFVCDNEDINKDEMYEATIGNGSLECTNYTELTTI